MRKISKTHPPRDYREWLAHGYDYDDLMNPEKENLLEHLIKEQAGLCAYTGLEIDKKSAHIEHVKPQCHCTNREDVDYRNMVACFPREGGATSHGFGAPVRGSWWDRPNFVSPLDDGCEARFRYTWSGKMHSRINGSQPEAETIAHLGLDSAQLRDLRRAAIKGFFVRGKDVTREQAAVLRRNVDQKDHDGRLKAFCFVYKYLLDRVVGSR